MAKKMTHSEQLVGRRLPPLPSYIDQLMASFIKGGEICNRMTPGDSWLRPAHARARKNGWIRHSGLSFGKGMDIWMLTESGYEEAWSASYRVAAANLARAEWSRELMQVYRNAA